jgi:F-type H+-transporting ATPase subunit epsilon
MNLHVEIITPEKVVYKDDVSEIVVPTETGQITILPNHVNLLTRILPGEMLIKKGAQEHYLAITGGFLEISSNKVSILADYAVRAEDIELAKAQEAQKRAEHKIKEKTTDNEFRIAEAELQKAVLQLKIAGKRKRHIR